MRNSILSLLLLLTAILATAQDAPDFTVTDTRGNVHQLYNDYLDNGKTVVLKLFFVGCPPCTNIAPEYQHLYESWGAGNDDVVFLSFSTRSIDSNSGINNYLNGLGVTVPASGTGGGFEASEPYRESDFGDYWGTPTFIVIAPDGEVVYFASNSNLIAIDNAIRETGASGVGLIEDPTNYTFNFADLFGNPVNNVSVKIIDLNPGNDTEYDVALNGLNEFSIQDFDEEYPGITNPAFHFTPNGPANQSLSSLDLITINKHILDVELFTNPEMALAADVNGSNSVSSADMIIIRKLILDLLDEFPNGLSNYIITDNDRPVEIISGDSISIYVKMIKRGNVK